MLEHKSGNISETRKDRGKVTMESLYEVTNALSNGTIPNPLIGGSQPQPQAAIAVISGMDKATNFKFCMHVHKSTLTKAH